jgi:hypothetical protein
MQEVFFHEIRYGVPEINLQKQFIGGAPRRVIRFEIADKSFEYGVEMKIKIGHIWGIY